MSLRISGSLVNEDRWGSLIPTKQLLLFDQIDSSSSIILMNRVSVVQRIGPLFVLTCGICDRSIFNIIKRREKRKLLVPPSYTHTHSLEKSFRICRELQVSVTVSLWPSSVAVTIAYLPLILPRTDRTGHDPYWISDCHALYGAIIQISSPLCDNHLRGRS